MSHRPFQKFCFLLIGLGLVASVGAQEQANIARGFDPTKVYDSGSIDHVNLFNGNLTLTIPLGGQYPAGGRLSTGLTLVYNSKAWRPEMVQIGLDAYAVSVEPAIGLNAGLGWSLSLGQLLAPGDPGNTSISDWVYVGPDGAEHVFYPRLHEGDPAVPGFYYSRDGSYLRLQVRRSRTILEFPDGTAHIFGPDNQLNMIRDRFGNRVDIVRTSDRWELRDQYGRVQIVEFTQVAGVHEDLAKVVDRVQLESFGSQPRAIYDFSYEVAEVQRGCGHTIDKDYTITAPILTSVRLPDGSVYSMPLSSYNLGGGPGCDNFSGLIERIDIPTGGALEWDYGPYRFPARKDGDRCFEFYTRTVGVHEKRMRTATDNLAGRWTYDPELDILGGCVAPGIPAPKQLKTTVTDGLGHRTENYFNVDLRAGGAEYGLPYTPLAQSGKHLLSRRVIAAGSSSPLRSTYVRYEWDQSSDHSNQRLTSRRTIYHDDGGKRVDFDLSSFDGLGHYRTSTVTDTFGNSSTWSSTTRYNPGFGTGVPWPTSKAWVLNTYDLIDVTQGGVTARSEACFDVDSGFLRRSRTLRSGTTRGARDLITEFTDSNGDSWPVANGACATPRTTSQGGFPRSPSPGLPVSPSARPNTRVTIPSGDRGGSPHPTGTSPLFLGKGFGSSRGPIQSAPRRTVRRR